MFSRTNIPFLIAGAIASLTLLTSGVFAVAPYVAFLSSVAALNVALPIIFISFALSAVVIAFSYKMIKQNKKSQENSKAEVEEPNKGLRKEENTRAPIIEVSEDEKAKENEEELSDKERETDKISELKNKVEELEKNVSDLFARLVNSPATKDEVEVKLNMKFYEKDEERGWNTTFDNIILPSNIKEGLREICKSKGGGYLLNGKGGTGKTSICEAIANEIKSQFAVIRISASSLCNIANIDQVFERARESTPCIIIMEEIDGIGLDRESGKNKNVESLTHLLDKLNKTFLKENIVIATTNCADDLDEALVRDGRLGRRIEIPGLEKESTRRGILKEHLKELIHRDIETIVNSTNGFSVANLIGLAKYIREEREKMKSKGKSTPISTLCKNFKKEHNIKDEPDKKHSNGKTKNEGTRLSSGSSRSLSSRSLSRSTSVSSSLSDVFSQENNTPAISSIATQSGMTPCK